MLDDLRRHPPAVPRRAEDDRVPQAAQAAGAEQVREAIDTYGMARPATAGWSACRAARTAIPCLPSCTELKWRGLLPVDLLACNLDQGQPGFPATVLPDFLTRMGVPHRIEYQDTYSVVLDKIASRAARCVRCVRGCGAATFTGSRAKRAVRPSSSGHHRDDILETFFMNLFHGGRLATMPPRLLNEDGDLFVARPLAFVAEADCDRFARAMAYPIIPCDLCGSQEGLQRAQVKKLLDDWESAQPRPPAGDVPRADERAALASGRSRAVRLCRR
jgi:tRNA 2-thiocytidine biosynthesis protein TtcA